GAVLQPEFVWTLADIANACMAYCNLPAILLLYPACVKNCKK
ncbi:MAG: alanine:cation symporter family protein, partial [Oscillospiraceae bacterium]|nr:alanine:cation symporter family protein [Oscillospiraceae bacterium]